MKDVRCTTPGAAHVVMYRRLIMRSTPMLFCHLAVALIAAGAVAAQAADGRYYDPSNAASPTGMTTGYTLYRTIGCPGRALLDTPCPVTEAVAAAPVTPVSSVMTPVRSEQYCGILDFRFEIDQDDIQQEEKEKLAAVGDFLTRHSDSIALIEGHTDNVGTPEYNLALSQRRAESVVRYLVENIHIAPARLTAVGYGDTRPLVANDSELGKRMNRRIDAVIACATDVAGLTVIPARLSMALRIEFDQNKADLKPQYAEDLSKVAFLLKANPTVSAAVEGHASNLQTTPELAMDISRQRAQNVVNYLIDNFGIAPARLTAEGFGQTRRVAYDTSLAAAQENSRVNIIFNYPK